MTHLITEFTCAGYVSGPSVKSVNVTSLIDANYDDVHDMLFVITRKNIPNKSGVSLHETFSLQELSLKMVFPSAWKANTISQ